MIIVDLQIFYYALDKDRFGKVRQVLFRGLGFVDGQIFKINTHQPNNGDGSKAIPTFSHYQSIHAGREKKKKMN